MLPSLRLGFDHPGYLWLLAALPVLWWIGSGPLQVLGPWRRRFALLFRTIVWVGVVLAIAGVQLVWVSDRVTVMYVLDQSESIPLAKRQVMLDYVTRSVATHRNHTREDRVGIIVFGRDAIIEMPPFDEDIAVRRLESNLDRTDATDIESALNLAQASMPEDTARRIVIVTDGNENLGRATQMASRLGDAGIGIDVVPVELDFANEVLVEKVDLPTEIRTGQPFEARIVVTNYSDDGGSATQNAGGDASDGDDSDGDASGPVKGLLRVKQSVSGEESLLLEQEIELDPGKNVFPLQHTIDQPAPYTYEAEFIPQNDDQDGLRKNNRATGFTYVRGKGRVLLIEDRSRQGDFDLYVQTLRDADIEVTKQNTDQLFGSLAELQTFDAVILAGVPRVGGGEGSGLVSFTDEQIQMLVRNTQQLGAGLLMIGGPESLGAGGWTGTELEKAMPVDFKIRNTKIQAVGALALIMHASEMAEGNHWQKVIARAAVKQLGPADYAGLLHWTMGGDAWLWGGRQGLLPVGPNRQAMMAAIGRMTPGDMPQFDPAMRMAAAALTRTPASMKHCVIISDGDPSDPTPGTIAAFKNNNITISTVAVASHGLTESQRLRRIAQATGGKYHQVKDGRALPEIFQREARRVARPLVFEPSGGTVPEVIFPHPMLDGVDRVMPRIGGFVLTQTKNSPLAQVLIQSPKPDSPENATILAAWTYGLGRTAVLTTDAGARWASSWTPWNDYEKFHSQLVRWLMRPTGDTGKFTLATQVRDGEVEVIVNALDKDDEFLNFLEMNATALDPELKPIALSMRQVAPGRYVGRFPVDQAGSYFVNVIPDEGTAPLTTGVSVPFSEEYRVRRTNLALINALAETKVNGGEAGIVMPAIDQRAADELVQVDTFRGGLPPARSIKDAWPWFLLAACVLFLFDVAVRRIAISFAWLGRWVRKRFGKAKATDTPTTRRLDELRQSKDAVSQSIDARRRSVRFDPQSVPTESTGQTSAPESSFDSPASSGKPPKESAKDGSRQSDGSTSDAPVSYTERLLEAKRRARKNRD
ncbi:VWA domain-containing protein [Crateriforma spongiae]|uniref:VWA domain-containing protein n=1 Tax=Crateriforma spongiae TaxID=2724528 RepID=UPI0036F1C473